MKSSRTGYLRPGADTRSLSQTLKGFALGTLVLAGGALSATAADAAIRVGPTDPDTGFPLWYEDESGLRLDLCTDLTSCFFELPDPGLPVSFPDNFPDEAFYWAAEAALDGGPNDTGTRAILVMAREAAFFNEGVVDGDQIVFSRIRFFIDGAPSMVGNEYSITHPYGVETFVSESGDGGPGVKGEGYSATHDVGITEPGAFSGSLAVFPTFLIAEGTNRDALKATPGALLDTSGGLASTRVQGSPLGTNFFRIEGPNIGDVYPSFQCADPALGGVKDGLGNDLLNDCVETDQFNIMGRVASRYGVQIDKASYDKVDRAPEDPLDNNPVSYVNIWAHTVEGQTIAARVDGGAQVFLTEGGSGHYFARLQEGVDFADLPAGGKPGSVQVMNLTDSPSISQTAEIGDNVIITSARWDVTTGTLEVQAQSSNHYEAPQLSVTFDPDSGNLTGGFTHNGAGLVTGTYSAGSSGGPGMPPINVRVTSLDGGTVLSPVTISGGVSGGGQVESLIANAGPDKAVNAGTVVQLNGADSTGAIDTWQWSANSMDVTLQCIDLPTCSQAEVITPDSATMTANGQEQIQVELTLTVTDAAANSDSDAMVLTVTNPASAPDDTCTVTRAEFNVSKEFWRVEGTSDIPDNQRISVYLGGAVFDPATAKFIGEGRVDALGAWEVRTARGSAGGDGTIPGAGDTHLHVESERGCLVSSTFINK